MRHPCGVWYQGLAAGLGPVCSDISYAAIAYDKKEPLPSKGNVSNRTKGPGAVPGLPVGTAAKKAEKTARSAVNSVEQAVEKNSSYENEVVTEGSGHNSDDNVGEGFHPFMIEKVEIKNKKSRAKKAAKGVEQKETKQIKETESNNVDIQFETGTQGSKNNNDKILKLHNTGKSNMIIAKELGLGIGEVKLVIDLFEGM